MKSLSDVADFLSGGTPSKGEPSYWNGDIPWYSASNMTKRFLSDDNPKITPAGLDAGSRIAPKGATLILVRGSGLFNYIPICFADKEVAFNQDVKAICPKRGTDAAFLHFWIESLRPRLKENLGVTGIGAGKFDTDFLKRLPFPDISEAKQQEIASVASAFDRKIDCNRRMNETLEAMARAMFKDWFVDFGPTRAKMEGRAPYLAPEIWSLFPDRLDDEGKPEGWNHASLSHFFTILGGGTPKTTEQKYWGGRILWFSVVDAPTGGDVYVIQTEKHITPQGLEGSSAQLVPAGTTIISARGTVGKLAIAAQEMTFNQSCYGLRRVPPVGDVFVYMAAKHMVSKLRQMSHGAVFSTITRQTFEAISLPAPQPQLLETFEDTASPFFDQIKANVLQSLSLAQTRDLLLPKLMSGEIRVKDAEKAVGDVL
jgi:type I restriction enzyme S subunit